VAGLETEEQALSVAKAVERIDKPAKTMETDDRHVSVIVVAYNRFFITALLVNL
jgi:hypothetical protein